MRGSFEEYIIIYSSVFVLDIFPLPYSTVVIGFLQLFCAIAFVRPEQSLRSLDYLKLFFSHGSLNVKSYQFFLRWAIERWHKIV